MAIAFTVAGIAVLVGTEILRSVVHRRREKMEGIGGTQDIAMWGCLIAFVGTVVCGLIWMLHR